MSGGISTKFFNLQMKLIECSQYPVIGIIPSIPQAVLSVIELVAGVVGTFFMAIASVLTYPCRGACHRRCVDARKESTKHIGCALMCLGNSMLNFATIGLGAWVFYKCGCCQ